MFFLKKVFLGLGLLFLISLGGAGTQSSSLFMQGMGFVGLLVGLVILYIFVRMVWKGLGCLPSFMILSAIVVFIMYALGMFNNGLGGVGEEFVHFLGYRESSDNRAEQRRQTENAKDFSENFEDNEIASKKIINPDFDQGEDPESADPDLFAPDQPAPTQNARAERKPKKSVVENMLERVNSNNQQKEQRAFNPNDYPVVYASVRVLTADTLEIYGNKFVLFGIDAPEANQTCADKQGRAYNCGHQATAWLKSWIKDNELECHVIKQDTRGNMLGTCSFGPYDLGAALVNAGWAVANPKHSDVYQVYELQAQKNRNGLWQGTFYKPWDWRKLQSRKPKIKVLKPKQRKMGIFG